MNTLIRHDKNCRVKNYMKIIADAAFAVAKRKPEKKNSGLYGIPALNLCVTGATLYPIEPTITDFIFITLIIILSRVYDEPIQRPPPSRLVGSIGRASYKFPSKYI